MNQSTTQQSKRRFRPVKLPVSGSQPISVSDLPSAGRPPGKPLHASFVSPSSVVPENVQILRQDAVSRPRPSMIVERRLDKYVDYYRVSRENMERSSGNLGEVVRPEAPPNRAPTAPVADQPVIKDEVHFVARTDFEFEFASSQWTTPVVKESIPLSEAALVQSRTFQRVDAADEPAGDAHLSFPVESSIDQVARELERHSAPDLAAQQIEASREQKVLSDPNTLEIVAAVSSAIASVIKNQSEDQLLPEAKNLFESNLKQHAVVLERDSAVSQSNDAGISEAMISSIAQQRQQAATAGPIASTVSPTSLASQLRLRIAEHQKSMIGSQRQSADRASDQIQAAEPDAGTTLTESQLPVAEMANDEEPFGGNRNAPPVKFDQTHSSSIPMDAAAWDVEDFRWPAITNQMILTGGPAIEQLLAIATSRTSAQPKRIVVSSAGRSQGATTIAITMARIAVAAGMRTLLVDADVASPSLSQRIGLAANMSWLNGVGKNLPVSELIVRSKANNLCMMPLSSTVTRVTWPRFIFDNLGALVSPGLQHFDLVLIDAGPVSQLLDELSSPVNLLDAVVLVDSSAKAKELEVYQNRLTTFGVDNLVLAENRKSHSASDVA